MLLIIDTHQHLWDLAKFSMNWMTPDSPLAQSFTPKEYAEAIEGFNVVKSIYMEVDVVKEMQQAEADYVIDLCKSGNTNMVAAIVAGHPADPGFANYVSQFRDSPYVKGVRQVIHVDNTPAGYSLQMDFIQGVRLLGDLGLSYDICIRPGELGDAAKLVDACPGTRFILDHCGNGPVLTKDRSQWKREKPAGLTCGDPMRQPCELWPEAESQSRL